jgi:hypothetical protein
MDCTTNVHGKKVSPQLESKVVVSTSWTKPGLNVFAVGAVFWLPPPPSQGAWKQAYEIPEKVIFICFDPALDLAVPFLPFKRGWLVSMLCFEQVRS